MALVADSDNVEGIPQGIPGLVAVATYTPEDISAAAQRFPGLPIFQINIGGNVSAPLPLALRVSVADVESGALTPGQARQIVEANPTEPIVIYHDISESLAIYDAFGGLTWRRPNEWPTPGWYEWVANPTGTPHCPSTALLCQYLWATGYDLSMVNPLAASFPSLSTLPPTPIPIPPPEPTILEEDDPMILSDGTTEWAVAGDLSRKIALDPAEASALWADISDKDQSNVPKVPNLLAKIPTVP